MWLTVLQAYENAGDLERQSEQVVPLQSKLELAINERDAALAKAEGLTPRPGLRAFNGLTPEGCKKLGAAFDAHRYGRAWTLDPCFKGLGLDLGRCFAELVKRQTLEHCWFW